MSSLYLHTLLTTDQPTAPYTENVSQPKGVAHACMLLRYLIVRNRMQIIRRFTCPHQLGMKTHKACKALFDLEMDEGPDGISMLSTQIYDHFKSKNRTSNH